MQDKHDIKRFCVSLFTATTIWYVAALIAHVIASHHRQKHFDYSTWYSNYASSFYDGFQQHVFYVFFILLTVLIGFTIRFTKQKPVKSFSRLLHASVFAILLIPIAAIGLNGIAIGTDWPSMSPPQEIGHGAFWWLPGFVILGYVILLEKFQSE